MRVPGQEELLGLKALLKGTSVLIPKDGGSASYLNVEQIYLGFFFPVWDSAEEGDLKFQTSWKVLGVSKVTQPSVA